VTFGATSLTFLTHHVGTKNAVELWVLMNPPIGSGTILVTLGVSVQFVVVGSVSYFNVVGTRTPSGNHGITSTPPSVSVTTSPDDLVIDTLAVSVGGSTTTSPTGPGQMQHWNSGPITIGPAQFFVGSGSDQPASGPSVTMSWSVSSVPSYAWSLIAVPLIPATPIPEYPLGLPILAIFTVIAYGLIKRKTRN
jgi:hypothetical protein